jgi:hypothetical protein
VLGTVNKDRFCKPAVLVLGTVNKDRFCKPAVLVLVCADCELTCTLLEQFSEDAQECIQKLLIVKCMLTFDIGHCYSLHSSAVPSLCKGSNVSTIAETDSFE